MARSHVERRKLKQRDRTRSYCRRLTAVPTDSFSSSVFYSLTQGQLVLHKSKTLHVMVLCPDMQRGNMIRCTQHDFDIECSSCCLQVVVPLSFLPPMIPRAVSTESFVSSGPCSQI
mgnify:CR=1 FL=1